MPRQRPPRQGAPPLRSEVEQLVGDVQRYFRGGSTVRSAFGQLASLVAELLGFSRGQRGAPSRTDIQDAIDVMAEAGLDPRNVQAAAATVGGAGRAGQPSAPRSGPQPLTATQTLPRPARGFRVGGTPPGSPSLDPRNRLPPELRLPPGGDRITVPGDADWPEEHLIDTRVISAALVDRLTGQQSLEWIETPQSSNVYSFAYDHSQSILYVTFKAPSNQRRRPHVTGATYAYGSKARPIPARMYESLLRASSKGEWVWDKLRVRGSRWRHQVPYILTAGGFDGRAGFDGDPMAHYIPRKATARGFRVRTVPVLGSARRRGAIGRSTLPEQIGPAYRQSLLP